MLAFCVESVSDGETVRERDFLQKAPLSEINGILNIVDYFADDGVGNTEALGIE